MIIRAIEGSISRESRASTRRTISDTRFSGAFAGGASCVSQMSPFKRGSSDVLAKRTMLSHNDIGNTKISEQIPPTKKKDTPYKIMEMRKSFRIDSRREL